jgi:hypothetical protein
MIRHYAVATLLPLFATACRIDISSPFTSRPGYCRIGLGDEHPCVELELYPRVGAPGSALLKGDTLRISTYSELGYATPVTWSITGEAATTVMGSEREETLFLGFASILVKGLQLGSATVTASHANPARTASSTITVVDSSIITQIVLWSSHEGTPPILTTNVRVGDSLSVRVTLMDAAGLGYTAQPELWSTTDTTVASIARHQTAPPASFVQTYARARSPGTVDVIASFLTVRGTLRITVVP